MNTCPPFTHTLLSWFRLNGRDLPWRGVADPYAIWLSEVILQQTRISQGTAYWHRFMSQFPTVHDLARASEDEVLRLWQGLGYYSRARHLHEAARQIAAAGAFPSTFKTIRQLPGVGDYTAAAVASMAFGEAVAAVDGNVYRVLSRHFDLSAPIDTARGKREFALLAQSLLPHDRPADFNQALMDFGAMVCTPRQPQCADCPFCETCLARRSGTVLARPVKQHTQQVSERRLTYVFILSDGQLAIHRRGAGDIWQGLWEPFNASSADGASSVQPDAILRLLQLDDREARLTLLAESVRHQLTHRLLLADFYRIIAPVRPQLPEDYIWVPADALDRYGVPRLIERMLEKALTPEPHEE